MKIILKSLVLVPALLLFSSCTLITYHLKKPSPAEGLAGCPGGPTATFHITLSGDRENDVAWQEKRTAEFVRTTEELLAKHDCGANRVSSSDDAGLRIDVEYRGAYAGTRPQDWLTGLSLGLIPSWRTEKDVWSISFEDSSSGIRTRYSVDELDVSHLILTPFVWVSFIQKDGEREYKKALNNYLGRRFHGGSPR